ncbi:MAG: hypothetical protein L6R40_003039 [Gallowayella cf. fulva]|nr:MAG: hypothetical protein L6R40_003039 [Xanthomendoza cf. fulva]
MAATNPIKAGDSFPDGVKFSLISAARYVPYTPEKEAITSCGMPQEYNASQEFANKKVVLFAVPGTCMLQCLAIQTLRWSQRSLLRPYCLCRSLHSRLLRASPPWLH